ncbi:MAG: TRAP transporter small permease [Pseudomonadota bacterium]
MNSLNRLCRLTSHVLLSFGAGVLAIMMFLTMTDVVLRYIFRSPITGAYEVMEYMMAILIPFGIVYCAHERGHVSVDIIFDLLSKPVKILLNCITSLIVLGLFLLVAWQNILLIMETYDSRLTSSVLYIPTYPFVCAVALGFVALCLVLLIDFFNFLMEAVRK